MPILSIKIKDPETVWSFRSYVWYDKSSLAWWISCSFLLSPSNFSFSIKTYFDSFHFLFTAQIYNQLAIDSFSRKINWQTLFFKHYLEICQPHICLILFLQMILYQTLCHSIDFYFICCIISTVPQCTEVQYDHLLSGGDLTITSIIFCPNI